MRFHRRNRVLAWTLAVMLSLTMVYTGQSVYAQESEKADSAQVAESGADSWRFDDGALSEEYLDKNAQMGGMVYDSQGISVAAGSDYGNKKNKKWVYKYKGKTVTCSGGYLKGIDVSYWQDRSRSNRYINWKKVKEEVKRGYVDFVIIRCGYGVDTKSKDDSEFAYNVKQCEERNIPYGVYLYSYAKSKTQAKSEAKHALRLLKGHYPDYPVYYDLEDRSILNATGKSKSKITEFARIFCTKLVNNGYKSGVYANLNWFTKYINGSKLRDSGCDLWLAQWFYHNKEYDAGSKYSIWQCCSCGSVSGIYGRVDLNLLVRKYSEMQNLMSDKTLPSTLNIEASDMSESEVKVESVTSRKGPGFGYKPSKEYKVGTIVTITEMANGYYHLSTGDWIAKSSVYQPNEPKEFDGVTFTSYSGEILKSMWVKYKGNTYYASKTGAVKTGIAKIGNYTYGFSDAGILYKSTSLWFGCAKYSFDGKGRAYVKKAVTKKKKVYRSGPGSSYKKKGTLKKGKAFIIIRTSGKWCQMTNGYWTLKSNLKTTKFYPVYKPELDTRYEAVVIAPCTGMSGPQASYLKLKTYEEGAVVTVVGIYGDWAKLTSGDWVLLANLMEQQAVEPSGPVDPDDTPTVDPSEEPTSQPSDEPSGNE